VTGNYYIATVCRGGREGSGNRGKPEDLPTAYIHLLLSEEKHGGLMVPVVLCTYASSSFLFLFRIAG